MLVLDDNLETKGTINSFWITSQVNSNFNVNSKSKTKSKKNLKYKCNIVKNNISNEKTEKTKKNPRNPR